MDAAERLTRAQLAEAGYLSASHVHRYELACRLCEGLRVVDVGCGVGYGAVMLADVAESVVGIDRDEDAFATAGARDNLRFEAADALEHLRRLSAADVDAVVLFEVLEHLPDPDAVMAELARLAATGVRAVLSVPNSRAFHEHNEHHHTDFGFATARAALADVDAEIEWAYQFLSEGSLILGEGAPAPADVTLSAPDQAEPEYANAFLVAVGFEAGVLAAASARLAAMVTPGHNRYMLDLERANASLERTNRELARDAYGTQGAGAAKRAQHYERLLAEYRERDWILSKERNRAYAARDAAQEELERHVAWHDAARYRAVDRAARAVRHRPAFAAPLRAVRWAYRRARPRP